jgi:hypothetical protein
MWSAIMSIALQLLWFFAVLIEGLVQLFTIGFREP